MCAMESASVMEGTSSPLRWLFAHIVRSYAAFGLIRRVRSYTAVSVVYAGVVG